MAFDPFAPSKMDGPFWTLWTWVAIPICTAIAIWKYSFATINWGIALASFYLMTIGVSLGFHRYFSHHAFKTSRPVQFIMAVLGTLSGQTGPISWALLHKDHHKYCETDKDPHATAVGFWHAHGFFLWNHAQPRALNYTASEWAKYPEIVFLERGAPMIHYALGIVIGLIAGFQGVVWYWMVPTWLCWNSTMLINSFAHRYGTFDYRDFHTPQVCNSTNLWWGFIFILGDNWHNNHHAYPNAAYHGWKWWQIDPNRYVLWTLQKLRLVWDPIMPSEKVLAKAKVQPNDPLPANLSKAIVARHARAAERAKKAVGQLA